jgi:hypothetical protein
MNLEQGLVAYLRALPTVAALVGERIYPQAATQGAELPYITYLVVSRPRGKHLTGSNGVVRPRVQLDAYTRTYADLRSLSDALFAGLDSHAGELGGFGDCRWASHDDEQQSYVAPADGSAQGTRRLTVDFIFTHRE